MTPSAANDELGEILGDFIKNWHQIDDHSVDTSAYDEATEAIAAYVAQAERKARDIVWQTMPAALTFNPHCKNCHANQLTLKHLKKPDELERQS